MGQSAEQSFQFEIPNVFGQDANSERSRASNKMWDEVFTVPSATGNGGVNGGVNGGGSGDAGDAGGEAGNVGAEQNDQVIDLSQLQTQQRNRGLDEFLEQFRQGLKSLKTRENKTPLKPERQANGCYTSPTYMELVDQVANQMYDPSMLGDMKELKNRYNCEIRSEEDAIKYASQAIKFAGDPFTKIMLSDKQFPNQFGKIGIALAPKGMTAEETDALIKDATKKIEGPFVVQSVEKDGAADKAGIKSGDEIVSVDGVKVGKKVLEDLSELIRGPKETVVKLGVMRGGELKELEIERAPYYSEADFNKPVTAEQMHRAGIGVMVGLLRKDGTSLGGHAASVINKNSDRTKRQEDDLVITQVNPGSPAERAGLRRGDVVKLVDGKDLSGKTMTDVTSMIRGASGRAVRLDVLRGDQPMQINIVREQLTSKLVSDRDLGGGAVYIRVEEFEQGLGDELEAVMNKHKNAKGFILDLRGNPGGLVTEAIETASIFIWKGPIVTLDQRAESPSDRPQYHTNRVEVTPDSVIQYVEGVNNGAPAAKNPRSAPYLLNGRPLGILINGSSASASEMFAGALHDNGAAFLIGEKTFGKGIGQTISGNESLTFSVTSLRYYTPKGTWAGDAHLNRTGILPDLRVVDNLNAGDPQLDKAVEILRKRENFK